MIDHRQRLQAFMRQDRQPIKAEVPTVKEGDGAGATTATIRLYDPIDSWGEWWGVSAKEFAAALDALPDSITEIRLLINSPGGEVTEGIAVLNLLRNHPARVVGVVEGLAASAASFIAAGCDELHMNPNAELLVHDAWGLCVGNAGDMRELADILDHLSDNIASVYVAKAGGSVADWRAVMATDTWYSAEGAVAAGLADSVTEPAAGAPPAARVDRPIFNSAGPKPAPVSANPPSPTPRPGQEGASMLDVTEIREALGLTEDTSDEDVLTAALDRLTEPPAPVPSPTPEAKLPEGVVAISEAQLEQLRTDAQAGVEARAQQLKSERESLVQAAVADGRIAPAERDAWLNKLETGTGAEPVLAALKPGVIPVNQLGHGGNADLESDDALYAELFTTEVPA
jgi:ATP-dependent protease ClpP protease subunit